MEIRVIKYSATTLLILTLITALTSCSKHEQKAASTAQKQTPSVGVMVIKPTLLKNEIYTTGTFTPDEQIELKTPVAGKIIAINFKEGEQIPAGKTLVQIDDRDWKASLKALETKLDVTRKDLDRKKELLKYEGVSKQEVDILESSVADLQAQIEKLKISIDYANIRAPFPGKIGLRYLSVGAYVGAGETITTLVKSNPIKIDFTISSAYADQIHAGQSLDVISKSGKDTLNAKVYAFEPDINSSSRTLKVRAVADNSSGKYFPGDFASIHLTLKNIENALMVPSESIIPQINSQIVYLMKNGKVSETTVDLGIRTDSTVQIVSGISPGDSVITTGLLTIKPNMPVKPMIYGSNADSKR